VRQLIRWQQERGGDYTPNTADRSKKNSKIDIVLVNDNALFTGGSELTATIVYCVSAVSAANLLSTLAKESFVYGIFSVFPHIDFVSAKQHY
jgi:hypothetical protein